MKNVAAKILSQIGNLARLSWGVKTVLTDTSSVSLKMPRNVTVTVELAPSDTYTVKLWKMNSKTFDCACKATVTDVYAADLVRIIDGVLR